MALREQLKKLSPEWGIKVYKKVRYLSITALFGLFRLLPIQRLFSWFVKEQGKDD